MTITIIIAITDQYQRLGTPEYISKYFSIIHNMIRTNKAEAIPVTGSGGP
jgi:hypothetical protein